MRFLFAGLLAVLTFIGCAQAQTLRALLKDTLENWNKPTEPFKIIGNIYYVGTNGLASYLVTSPQGHFLIDAALAPLLKMPAAEPRPAFFRPKSSSC